MTEPAPLAGRRHAAGTPTAAPMPGLPEFLGGVLAAVQRAQGIADQATMTLAGAYSRAGVLDLLPLTRVYVGELELDVPFVVHRAAPATLPLDEPAAARLRDAVLGVVGEAGGEVRGLFRRGHPVHDAVAGVVDTMAAPGTTVEVEPLARALEAAVAERAATLAPALVARLHDTVTRLADESGVPPALHFVAQTDQIAEHEPGHVARLRLRLGRVPLPPMDGEKGGTV